MSFTSITSKFNHFYLIPLFGLVCWYTLVFGLIGIYSHRGFTTSPMYGENAVPLPLERIGMIYNPGFFISFVVIHSLVFCSLMYLEFYHRKIGKLIKFIRPTLQTRLAYASIAIAIVAQLFFIGLAVAGTLLVRNYKRAASHYAALLATFAILVMISLALNFTNYYLMGQYYRKYVNGERWNKFTISFILKIIWLTVTLSLLLLTVGFYSAKHKNIADVLEWTFHIWYGLLLAFWTYDLYPLTELRALRARSASHLEDDHKPLLEKLRFWQTKTQPEPVVMSVTPTSSGSNSVGELDSPYV